MDSVCAVKKIELLILPVLTGLGFRLVDCEYLMDQGRWVLRIYIDKEGGITVGDCQKASRAVEGVLDVENVIPQRYSLEVSSPGLNRVLKTEDDFKKFIGEKIRLKTVELIDGRGNYFGFLVGVENKNVVMNVDGTVYKIPLEKLAKARLEYKM